MKKISGLIVFLFSALYSFAQIPNKVTISNPQTQYQIYNNFPILSLRIPIIDTTNNKATPYVGAVTILPQDTVLKSGIPPIYMSNGLFWGKIAGTGSAGVDSVTFPNNSMCVWSGGISTCYPLSRYYDSSALNSDSTYTYHFNNGVFLDSIWNPHTRIFPGEGISITDSAGGKVFSVTGFSVTDTASIVASWGQIDFPFPIVPTSYKDFIIMVNGVKIRAITDFTKSGDVVTIPTIDEGDLVEYIRIK